ncbi:alpha/beta hydrolase [Halioxenophilus aromaticivorans]|uniref:Alpha/beta hydrolase n=2 Tax=Halioxenophilus aromaticivorans TaxID=1306992 RepID=A0AAV3U5D9_9ALTE
MANSPNGDVHYLTWNWQEPLPVMCLVHGFRAHARWWDALAPFFTDRYRVLSIDLPGMGDSGPALSYHQDTYAEGILAVLESERLSDVTVIGHSFGGAQTIRALCLRPERFRRAIVVDSLVCLPGEDSIRLLEAKQQQRLRSSREDCIADFRLLPEQPVVEEAILYHIAYHSCRPQGAGWRWKFDPAGINYGEILDVAPLRRIAPRVDCIYGGQSMFAGQQRPEKTLALFGNPGRLITIEQGYHHLMLDQPLVLKDAISSLLSCSENG